MKQTTRLPVPDLISTVKLMARENKTWNNGEESTDGQTPGHGGEEIQRKSLRGPRAVVGGRRCLLGAACRGQERAARDPLEDSLGASQERS